MHGESVRLDSGLSLPVEEVARGVDAVNDHIRDSIQLNFNRMFNRIFNRSQDTL